MATDKRYPNDDSWKDESTNAPRTKSRLPENDSWKNDPTTSTNAKEKQNFARHSQKTQNARMEGPQGIVDSMATLSINHTRKGELVPKGRCLDWERPVSTSITDSKVSKNIPRSDGDYLKNTPSAYSISYKRSYNQTPMEEATYLEYLPFLKAEFRVGMIIRMNIHESDFKGTSKAAIAMASQASTMIDGGNGGKRRKEHRHHGDFGPIYSENRICIVVNVAKSMYSAVPLFTHGGNGLANTHPDERYDWISVQDHRQLNLCQQQSEHEPLRTSYMNPQARILDAVSTAWIPYAFPCRFDVPVAYQGTLDSASAERLVRLHLLSWDGNPYW